MLQLDATNSSREVEKFPMEVGRVPLSGLSASTIFIKLKFVKDERKLNSRLEDSLAKKLFSKMRFSRYHKFPKVFGIVPEKQFESNSSLVSIEAFKIELGIIPSSILHHR